MADHFTDEIEIAGPPPSIIPIGVEYGMVSAVHTDQSSARVCFIGVKNKTDFVVNGVKSAAGEGTILTLGAEKEPLHRNQKTTFHLEQDTPMDDLRLDAVFQIMDGSIPLGYLALQVTWSVSDSAAKCLTGFVDGVDKIDWTSEKHVLKVNNKKLHVLTDPSPHTSFCSFDICLELK